jgi:hypothetical protein
LLPNKGKVAMEKFRVRALFREKLLGHSPQQIFSRLYERNSWGNADSASGDGSDLTQTRVVRAELPRLIESLGVETLLDAPCGDYYWMRSLNLKLKRYVGADIVPALVRANQENYASDIVLFRNLDITRDELPPSDLILCRDCLVHLPLRAALDALHNFERSGSRYLLTTTYPNLLNTNKQLVITGNWRPIDLTLPPFSLPAPTLIINEECTEADDFKEKSLGLWDLCQLPL